MMTTTPNSHSASESPTCAIVQLSELREARRMDPGWFMGYIKECRDNVDSKRHAARIAIGRYRAAKTQLAAEEARMEAMRQRDGIKFIT